MQVARVHLINFVNRFENNISRLGFLNRENLGY